MLYSYLSKMMKNVCANSKIDSILKFVCVMLTYPARLPMLDEAIQDEAARPPMLDEAEPQYVQTTSPNFLRFQSSVRLIPVG